MTRTLTALGLIGAIALAMTGAPALAAETDSTTGSGHGDRITWPCPGTPST